MAVAEAQPTEEVTEQPVVAEATAIAEAVAEAEPVVVEAADNVLKEVAQEQDEDQILEALIRGEEEVAPQPEAESPQETETGFSVEDLESFTLEEMELGDEEDEDEGDGDRELDLELVPGVAVLTPDAGKIRFAEDIVDESRGSGRRDRKGGRRSGGGGRGSRRGGR